MIPHLTFVADLGSPSAENSRPKTIRAESTKELGPQGRMRIASVSGPSTGPDGYWAFKTNREFSWSRLSR